MALMQRSSWSRILAVGLRDIFITALKGVDYYGERVLVSTKSTKKEEDYQTIGGMGIAQTFSEGAAIPNDNLTQGYDKVLTNVSYGLGFTVTKLLHDDDQYGIIRGAPAELARAMKRCVEFYSAGLFNNCTSTTTPYGTADGLGLLSTAHLQLDGNTYGNKPSTDIDLSVAALEAAYTSMMLIEDDASNVTPYVPKMLVCHPSDRWTAEKILGSTQDPDSANNTINPLSGALELVVWPYLTDTNAWFVLSAKSDRKFGPMIQWREKPNLMDDTVVSTRTAEFNAMQRFVCGAVDWRGVYGSTGG